MKYYFLLLFSVCLFAQKSQDIVIDNKISATIFTPASNENDKIILIIPGNGPTDKNGNTPNLSHNNLKILAEQLSGLGYTVLSYDKTPAVMVREQKVDENLITIDLLISEANQVKQYVIKQFPFKKLIVIGQQEGALIGSEISRKDVNAYVSISASSYNVDERFIEQTKQRAPEMAAEVSANFAKLKKGEKFKNENQKTVSIFRESIQNYMISVLKFPMIPSVQKLKIPILFINGERSINITAQDSQRFLSAVPKAELAIIPKMNDIFREVESTEIQANYQTYEQPELPISTELVSVINQFAKKI